MQGLWLVGIVVGGLALLGAGVAFGEKARTQGGKDLSPARRVLLFVLAGPMGLGAGLSRMAKLMPKSWSDHPESKHPRHHDYWPPR